MRSPFRTFLRAVLSLSLCGCAHSYRGPEPDFTKAGEAAQSEYDSFRMNEIFWRQAPRSLMLGPDDNRYWIPSLQPVMENVSPESYAQARRARWWTYAAAAALAGSAVLFVSDVNDNSSARMSIDRQVQVFGLLGLSLSFAWAESAQLKRSAQLYNERLRSHFTTPVRDNEAP